jgi:hypothetical protein
LPAFFFFKRLLTRTINAPELLTLAGSLPSPLSWSTWFLRAFASAATIFICFVFLFFFYFFFFKNETTHTIFLCNRVCIREETLFAFIMSILERTCLAHQITIHLLGANIRKNIWRVGSTDTFDYYHLIVSSTITWLPAAVMQIAISPMRFLAEADYFSF